MAAVLGINECAFATTNVFPHEEVATLNGAFRADLASLSDLLDTRARAGDAGTAHVFGELG